MNQLGALALAVGIGLATGYGVNLVAERQKTKANRRTAIILGTSAVYLLGVRLGAAATEAQNAPATQSK